MIQQSLGIHPEKILIRKDTCTAMVIAALFTFGKQPKCPSRDEWRASLVAQWSRICLPMQGTRVQALVWEDPTYRGATRPVSHNC